MKLTYRDSGLSGTQLTVFSGKLAIAILWKHRPADSKTENWRWTFTLAAGPDGFQHHGKAESSKAARACLESNWQNWLDAAALNER